jgi:hypothetical protein
MTPEDRLAALEARNARVDVDKAWETSYARRAVIAAATYLTAGAFMQINGFASPWLGAGVPVLGYLLSTLSLPWVRRWWQGRK